METIATPRISLVAPMYKTEAFLKEFCESVITQDFKNWECFVVSDGPSDEGKTIVASFNDPRLKFVEQEHRGVCATRNHGKSLATGEYIAFTSSDFRLRPGCLRRWIQAFEDHPEVDFVYGAYGLISQGKEQQVFQSEPFDPIQLETYPYIDGGFPIKRAKCPEWDESIPSLNDWDFWLKAVKRDGCVGHYLHDVSFDAEIPRLGGLSHDSSTHWVERKRQVQKNNGIRERKICVSSLGAPFHGKRVARILDEDFNPMPSYKPHTYDMIYLLGWYNSNAQAHAQVFTNTDDRVVKVVHWIGTDVVQMRRTAFENVKALVTAFKKRHIVHLCECDWIQKELSEMGIGASILPLPIDLQKYPLLPLPKEFTVGVYAPKGDEETFQKYHLALMNSLVWTMPDVKFLFFGGARVVERDNEKHVGWIPIHEVLPQCSMLVRLTQHDGLPIAPIEFLMSGREVITSCPLKYAHQIDASRMDENTYPVIREKVVSKIRQVQSRPADAKYFERVRAHFGRECRVDTFAQRIHWLLPKKEKTSTKISSAKEVAHV